MNRTTNTPPPTGPYPNTDYPLSGRRSAAAPKVSVRIPHATFAGRDSRGRIMSAKIKAPTVPPIKVPKTAEAVLNPPRRSASAMKLPPAGAPVTGPNITAIPFSPPEGIPH